MDIPTFHVADYVVFGVSIASSAMIGFYFAFCGKKNKTTADQLVAGRSLSAIPVSISALASILSATFIIGIPGEVYGYGPMYSTIFAGYMLCVPWTAFGFIPTFYNMQITSAYEYIEKRFNKYVQGVSSVLFAVMQLLYMAVSIYAPAVAFSQVTGLSEYITMLGLGVVCTLYTAMGGMKAVVWTDVLQMSIILVGLIIIVTKGTIDVGGVGKVMQINSDGGRLDFSEVGIHPSVRHSWWTQTIGGCFVTMTNLTSNQAMIQRYISIRTLREAKLCPLYMLLFVGVVLGLVTSLGWVMYAYYVECDPISAEIVKPDQIMPLFMMQVLGGLYGIPGLFASAVFAATLSTLSSGVNAMAAVVLMDMIQPIYLKATGKPTKERASSFSTKVLAAVIGMLCVGLAYVAPLLGSTLIQLTQSVFGMVGGPLLGLFIMAIFMPCINAWGALCGLIGSLIITAWISIGTIIADPPRTSLTLRQDGCPNTTTVNTTWVTSNMLTSTTLSPTTIEPDTGFQGLAIYELSYMWYAAVSVGLCILIALPISYLTGGNKIREKRFYFDYDSLFSVCGLSACCYFDEKSTANEDQVYADVYVESQLVKAGATGPLNHQTPLENQFNGNLKTGVYNIGFQGDEEPPYYTTYQRKYFDYGNGPKAEEVYVTMCL